MVRQMVASWPANPDQNAVYELLRLLGRWRSQMLANTFVQRQGARIWGGPFGVDNHQDAASRESLEVGRAEFPTDLHAIGDAIARCEVGAGRPRRLRDVVGMDPDVWHHPGQPHGVVALGAAHIDHAV